MSKIYLNVPYDEKDDAKKLGARWDNDAKKWYATEDKPALIERWGTQARRLTELRGEDRTYGGNRLCVELLPKSCWCKKIQYAIQHCDRDRVQDFVLGRTNRTCETCGVSDTQQAYHMHGRWLYDTTAPRPSPACCRCVETATKVRILARRITPTGETKPRVI
jgi:hypothetical protein